MSPKTHLIFYPFFGSILQDKYLFICRNMDILLKLNFAENYSRIEGPSKTRRNRSQSRNEVAT